MKLKQTDPETFERMRTILGYHEFMKLRHGGAAAGAPPKPLSHVTISTLQTIKFQDYDQEFKRALLGYKLQTLNEELAGLLDATEGAPASAAAHKAERPQQQQQRPKTGKQQQQHGARKQKQ